MKYFSEDNEFVNAECEMCKKVLKIKKTRCNFINGNYYLDPSAKCICGNISNRIEAKINPKVKSDEEINCPNCSSKKYTVQQQGFGWGKALVGGVLTGGIGLLGGFIGSKKISMICLSCGHKWKP